MSAPSAEPQTSDAVAAPPTESATSGSAPAPSGSAPAPSGSAPAPSGTGHKAPHAAGPAAAGPADGGHGGHGAPGALMLSALGVVFGDIGTSPLYAFKECFHGTAHGAPEYMVLGVLSLMFWALIIVVSLKYLAYVMLANDKGEGGILTLMAMADPRTGRGGGSWVALALGLFGSGLLFGDAIITPAISVLSAVEGVKDVAPVLEPLVVPATLVILVILFVVQRWGTASVGTVFGPVMVLWFATLAGLGVASVVNHPAVLAAASPHYAVLFLMHDPLHSFFVLGSVFLVVTGGEALYADMGHFGLPPIRRGWFAIVLPALLASYFGQGALVLKNPEAVHSPFFSLAPSWALIPLVALATLATVIASQAVISGMFSLSRQAMMLGFWPRMQIAHTSPNMIGQIYVPAVNWGLMLGTIGLVLAFRSSSALAAAYGIAVTTTMVITTLLMFAVTRRVWGWSIAAASAVTIPFVAFDLAFFFANVAKVAQGGWIALAVSMLLLVLMSTWRYGREKLGEGVRSRMIPLEDFWELIHVERPARVPGTAVFMTSNPGGTPPALLHNFLLNRVVHAQVIILTVQTLETARLPSADRVSVKQLREGFLEVQGRYGYMETPNVPELLEMAQIEGFSIEHATFFLGREIPLAALDSFASWRERLFATMARNSLNATTFFNLPPDRVLEIGYQLEL